MMAAAGLPRKEKRGLFTHTDDQTRHCACLVSVFDPGSIRGENELAPDEGSSGASGTYCGDADYFFSVTVSSTGAASTRLAGV